MVQGTFEGDSAISVPWAQTTTQSLEPEDRTKAQPQGHVQATTKKVQGQAQLWGFPEQELWLFKCSPPRLFPGRP